MFLSHVLYYVHDTLGHHLKRAREWLAPGGAVVVVIDTGGTEEHPVCHTDLSKLIVPDRLFWLK